MNRIYLVAAFLLLGAVSGFARKKHDAPGTGNPVIPGYFADPTIKKFGDTYYMYATTDGSGAGFGPAQVWTSKDFVNWTLMPMNWPDSHWIWAPDVIRHTDGRYYYFYCQPCIIHCGVSETPRGPWKNILGESEAVLVPDRFVTNAITLDGQTFVDDDGSVYLYWGTWGIYKGFGCGAGKMTPDLKGFTETRLIPNTEAVDFFEAPFVLKRNGIYYFMYSSGSCHDHTYRVQYATSDHPLGPYEYKGCILETNEDGTVHGPGHHSILKEGDDYYIVYHRHDNPHSNRGFHRQLCMDKMEFAADGSIRKVIPTHKGVGALAPSVVKSENLALGAGVRASSCYDDNFRAEYAVDDNNGTLWRPRGMGQEWLEIDLGSSREIQTVWTQFEYGTQFYQYLIETSVDGKHWSVFADKRNNHLAGSPMVDFGKAEARYVRLTFTGGQKNGFGGAVWNVKVFGGIEEALPQQWLGLTAADCRKRGLVVSITADDFAVGDTVPYLTNRGVKGYFEALKAPVVVKETEGKKAFHFDGSQLFRSSFSLPATLQDNAPYTLEAWVLNDSIAENECVADFTTSHDELEKIMLVNGTEPRCGVINHYGWYEDAGYKGMKELTGRWQHIYICFDGRMEQVYINGEQVSGKDIQLLVKPSQFVTLGRNAEGEWPFTGYLHSLKLWDEYIPLQGRK